MQRPGHRPSASGSPTRPRQHPRAVPAGHGGNSSDDSPALPTPVITASSRAPPSARTSSGSRRVPPRSRRMSIGVFADPQQPVRSGAGCLPRRWSAPDCRRSAASGRPPAAPTPPARRRQAARRRWPRRRSAGAASTPDCAIRDRLQRRTEPAWYEQGPKAASEHQQSRPTQRAVAQPGRLPAGQHGATGIGCRRRLRRAPDSNRPAGSPAAAAPVRPPPRRARMPCRPWVSCPVLTRSTVSPSSRCSSRASVCTERIRLRGNDNALRCSTPVRSCDVLARRSGRWW